MPKRWAPGVPDLVFGLVLFMTLYAGRSYLVNDPGTFWHLQLGREILASGALPRADTFTFTHTGEPWVDQSWLFDLALAVVVDRLGWSAAVLIASVGLAAVYAGLARALGRDGRPPMVAFGTAFLAAGAGSLHFLIRPHLFTIGFVFLTLRICQEQHEKGGRRVFAVPFLTALWANLHGGFLVGPFIVFTAAAAHWVSDPFAPGRRRGVATFLAAGVLSVVTALANPYGFGLYRHVAHLLGSSGVTKLISEYGPIPFGAPIAQLVEWMILAFVALPTISRSRMSRYETVHTLVWLHISLACVRQVPLFAIAAAPGLASLLEGVFTKPESTEESPEAPAWFWPGMSAAGLAVAVACGARLIVFDPTVWPLAALPVLNAEPSRLPLFHEQDWGGMIASETLPKRPSYLDDRFELYGTEEILRYLNAIEGGPDWDEIRDRDRIALVWVRPARGLARKLRNDPSWRVRYRDAVSILFERVDPVAGGTSTTQPRLDKFGPTNEPAAANTPGSSAPANGSIDPRRPDEASTR